MAKYISSFIIPVPKKNLKAYQGFANKIAKLWLKNGALEYSESIADDVSKGKITSFPRSVKLKPSETVVVGHAVFKSKAHREQVMTNIHNDEAMMNLWEAMPFDGMRMIWGGFKTIVSAKA